MANAPTLATEFAPSATLSGLVVWAFLPTATLLSPLEIAFWPMATLSAPLVWLSAPVLLAWKYFVPVL